jgi:hypothetical protein
MRGVPQASIKSNKIDQVFANSLLFVGVRRLCPKSELWEASLTPIRDQTQHVVVLDAAIAVRDRSYKIFWAKQGKTQKLQAPKRS